MAVNKVVYDGATLVDLTSDTVTADDLAAGVTATGADGKPVVGLLPKVTIDTELSTTSTNPVQNKTITAALSNLDIDIATTSVAGLMSSTDKSKLDSIAANANNYVHPASHPASMITGLAAVATSGSYSDLTGTPGNATTSAAGLMSAADKAKLDKVDADAGSVKFIIYS